MPAFYLILTCALWGLSFPVIKALQLEQADRLTEASSAFLASWLQFSRFLISGLLMLPLLIRAGRPTRLELKQGLLLGFWGGLGMGIQAWGLSLTEASTSAFLTQAYCVILPIIACVRLRKAPDRRTIGATFLVVIGGAILAGIKPGSLTLGPGETATLVAACAFTFQILTLDAPRFASNRGGPVTVIMCVFIGLAYLPVSLLSAPDPSAILEAGASISAAFYLFVLVVFCSIAAYLLMNTWQRRVSATEAGLIYTTEPVFAAAYALVLPVPLTALTNIQYANETITSQMLVGGGLIILANVLMQWKAAPHKPSIAPIP